MEPNLLDSPAVTTRLADRRSRSNAGLLEYLGRGGGLRRADLRSDIAEQGIDGVAQ